MAAERANGTQLSGFGPARHRFGVDAEHRRNFGGCQQGLGIIRLDAHQLRVCGQMGHKATFSPDLTRLRVRRDDGSNAVR